MTKVEKLIAAYESFGRALADVPGEDAQNLLRLSLGVRDFVASALKRTPRPTPSQVAAGLEQGWRETPMMIQDMTPELRVKVVEAWQIANAENYPEFLLKEKERLKKVTTRGKIRTEAEFYRVRHEIDVLEGSPSQAAELHLLYRLIDAFESR